MSEPREHHGGFLADAIEHLEPIPVRVMHDPDAEKVKNEVADFGALHTIQYLTGAEGPFQLLPQANKRYKAIIIVQNGFANNNNVGYLVFGSRAQCQNAGITGAVGGIVTAGTTFTYESKSELWVCGDGAHSLTVTVLDQRFQ